MNIKIALLKKKKKDISLNKTNKKMCLSIFTEAVCCAGKSFCNLFCCCCKKTCGTAFKQQVKLAYIILLAIALLFTVFCLYTFAKILDPFKRWIHCPEESGGKLQCLGLSAVYRMSITLASLFILSNFFFL